jgi:hypothetical protein
MLKVTQPKQLSVVLEMLIPTHLPSQENQILWNPKSWLSCSQYPTTGLCSEVDECRIDTLTLYSQHQF